MMEQHAFFCLFLLYACLVFARSQIIVQIPVNGARRVVGVLTDKADTIISYAQWEHIQIHDSTHYLYNRPYFYRSNASETPSPWLNISPSSSSNFSLYSNNTLSPIFNSSHANFNASAPTRLERDPHRLYGLNHSYYGHGSLFGHQCGAPPHNGGRAHVPLAVSRTPPRHQTFSPTPSPTKSPSHRTTPEVTRMPSLVERLASTVPSVVPPLSTVLSTTTEFDLIPLTTKCVSNQMIIAPTSDNEDGDGGDSWDVKWDWEIFREVWPWSTIVVIIMNIVAAYHLHSEVMLDAAVLQKRGIVF